MQDGQCYVVLYLVVMDWGYEECDYVVGYGDCVLWLFVECWVWMVDYIWQIVMIVCDEFGVCVVIYLYVGGYIEFVDEIDWIVVDILVDMVGLCFDIGYLYYLGMDFEMWLCCYVVWFDYVYFKDIDVVVYDVVMGEYIVFFVVCVCGVMCLIGIGVFDYLVICQVFVDIGYVGYIMIEQECDLCNVGMSLCDVVVSCVFFVLVGFV